MKDTKQYGMSSLLPRKDHTVALIVMRFHLCQCCAPIMCGILIPQKNTGGNTTILLMFFWFSLALFSSGGSEMAAACLIPSLYFT